eukprot:scaffold397796_cov46-Prasinocladus_malaysianus.AAC.2
MRPLGFSRILTSQVLVVMQQIRAAAVTTTADGVVHDVFEVDRDPDVTHEDIQCHVHAGVYKAFSMSKRPREE